MFFLNFVFTLDSSLMIDLFSTLCLYNALCKYMYMYQYMLVLENVLYSDFFPVIVLLDYSSLTGLS